MIRAILAASRPISWVNTAVPFALAYLLDTSRFDWPVSYTHLTLPTICSV